MDREFAQTAYSFVEVVSFRFLDKEKNKQTMCLLLEDEKLYCERLEQILLTKITETYNVSNNKQKFLQKMKLIEAKINESKIIDPSLFKFLYNK